MLGSCVFQEWGGPGLAPGTPGRGPRTRGLHLEGAPVSSLMVSEAESHGSPSAPAGGGIGAGRGGGVCVLTEHFLLPAGAPGLLRGEDSGWGWGWGWGPRRLRLRQARAAGRSSASGGARRGWITSVQV